MKTKHERNMWLFAILLALLFTLFAAVWSSRIIQAQKGREPQMVTGLEMDKNAVEGGIVTRSQEEIQAELNQKVEEGMINISMNTSPTFPSGKEKGNLLIVNSEVNNYPQVVYILQKDTGEEIYRSKGVPVGSKIEYAPLDVELPAGEYDCVAYFNNVDPVSGTILGTAGAEIKIIVQS